MSGVQKRDRRQGGCVYDRGRDGRRRVYPPAAQVSEVQAAMVDLRSQRIRLAHTRGVSGSDSGRGDRPGGPDARTRTVATEVQVLRRTDFGPGRTIAPSGGITHHPEKENRVEAILRSLLKQNAVDTAQRTGRPGSRRIYRTGMDAPTVGAWTSRGHDDGPGC